MSYPKPAVSLKVPSLHDSKLLETRIYIPHQLQPVIATSSREDTDSDQRRRAWCENKRAAVVAHPYATLGGNFNDHVIMNVVHTLLEKGWVVGTFNFRGAGKSEGSTSWTGQPEIGDYLGVVGGVLSFVDCLGPESEPEGQFAGRGVTGLQVSGGETWRRRIRLLMAGYSYGSLICSHLPLVEDMIHRIDSAIETPTYKTCIAGLRESARAWGGSSTSSDRIPASSKAIGDLLISGIEIEPHYLLISPLLPPLSSLLTLSMFSSATSTSLMSEELGKHKRGCILVVHGTADNFTSAAKYKKWRETWTVTEEGDIIQARTVVAVAGAGHLWIEDGAMIQLVTAIGKWADMLHSSVKT